MQYVTHGLAPQMVQEGEEVIFSYDVVFKMSNIRWASRWDTYLLMMDDQIHWFSIVNSLMIVVFLSGMVAMIMLRTLHRDISKYNQLETVDEASEEIGLKLVHGDVFRPPTRFGALTVYVGTGVQIIGMTVVTLVFAVLGFLSPSNRGGLMTAMLLLFALCGLFAGHSSARLFKMFQGTDWKSNTLDVAFLFPSVVFVVFFILNLLIWGQKSSGAVPFGTLFALFFSSGSASRCRWCLSGATSGPRSQRWKTPCGPTRSPDRFRSKRGTCTRLSSFSSAGSSLSARCSSSSSSS